MANAIISEIDKLKEKLNNLENTIQVENDVVVIKLKELDAKLHRAEIRGNKTNIDKKYKESIENERLENKKNGLPGKIRVGRVAGMYEKGRKYPITYGYKNISVVSLNQSNLGAELSPYKLRDDNGRLHENIWQFSKIYEKVPAQKQKSGWYWKLERHVETEQVKRLYTTDDVNSHVLNEYWRWRKEGMEFMSPVRYPVGFTERHNCLGCIWPYDDDYSQINNPHYPMKILGYVEARKKIYSKVYMELAKKTDEFLKLKSLLEDGYNLQILDVDCAQPNCGLEMTPGIYGEDGVGSVEINEKNIKFLLNNTDVPFGHSHALSCLLLDHPEWIE